ncbi:MAG: IclR family transcriptional regulator [Alphaproteobacteria bacterium]|nr:IclR family transcriptional regulator [Alphaproteobacteria bacterium]
MQIRQARQVLELLEYFAQRKEPATQAQIADHFDWPRSSTYNLVETLTDTGFLFQPISRGGYYPTPRWLLLAQAITEAQPLPEALHALAADLTRETEETTIIGGPAGTSAVFLHTVESELPVRYTAKVGHCVPIHMTATGRAILSQLPEKEFASIIRRVRFERFTDTSLLSVEEVEKEMQKARERGWHENLAGHKTDLYGVGLPLTIDGRHLSVVVAGPKFRMEHRMPEIAEIMKRAIARYGFGVKADEKKAT